MQRAMDNGRNELTPKRKTPEGRPTLPAGFGIIQLRLVLNGKLSLPSDKRSQPLKTINPH
jgi:hypothetical protein